MGSRAPLAGPVGKSCVAFPGHGLGAVAGDHEDPRTLRRSMGRWCKVSDSQEHADRSQAPKATYCKIPFTWNVMSRKDKSTETEGRLLVTGGGGVTGQGVTAGGTGVHSG